MDNQGLKIMANGLNIKYFMLVLGSLLAVCVFHMIFSHNERMKELDIELASLSSSSPCAIDNSHMIEPTKTRKQKQDEVLSLSKAYEHVSKSFR